MAASKSTARRNVKRSSASERERARLKAKGSTDQGATERAVGAGRRVRDPIHGDVELTPIQRAVVDTRIFQRLRYIKQNGLLHFVFPGAVHTRFAHSIGTCALARRVISNLFETLEPGAKTKQERFALNYIAGVFCCAALLHDVGHSAFSHAIESVRYKGEPFFGRLGELLEAWGLQELKQEFQNHHELCKLLPGAAQHEQIGLALVSLIFQEPSVDEVCRQVGFTGKDFGRDVRAMMSEDLAPSDRFCKYADAFGDITTKAGFELDRSDLSDQLLRVLHSLVSGTLDVDRLDYLVRDSTYCGVPYGKCDVDMLVNNLALGDVGGRLWLLLNRKAVYALDDMLWSRYQLFVQVLNHKSNVGMNAMLRRALEEAVADQRFEQPLALKKFIAFTDDFVVSNIFYAAMHGELENRTYTKALVDRRLPQHLGEHICRNPRGVAAEQKAALAQICAEHDLPESAVIVEMGSSVLLKGPLPVLFRWHRKTGMPELFPYEAVSTVTGGARPAPAHRVLHFFRDRPAE
jgi:HD superfamily phosphohydrolase